MDGEYGQIHARTHVSEFLLEECVNLLNKFVVCLAASALKYYRYLAFIDDAAFDVGYVKAFWVCSSSAFASASAAEAASIRSRARSEY